MPAARPLSPSPLPRPAGVSWPGLSLSSVGAPGAGWAAQPDLFRSALGPSEERFDSDARDGPGPAGRRIPPPLLLPCAARPALNAARAMPDCPGSPARSCRSCAGGGFPQGSMRARHGGGGGGAVAAGRAGGREAGVRGVWMGDSEHGPARARARGSVLIGKPPPGRGPARAAARTAFSRRLASGGGGVL